VTSALNNVVNSLARRLIINVNTEKIKQTSVLTINAFRAPTRVCGFNADATAVGRTVDLLIVTRVFSANEEIEKYPFVWTSTRQRQRQNGTAWTNVIRTYSKVADDKLHWYIARRWGLKTQTDRRREWNGNNTPMSRHDVISYLRCVQRYGFLCGRNTILTRINSLWSRWITNRSLY
jgi:hypothetical protein